MSYDQSNQGGQSATEQGYYDEQGNWVAQQGYYDEQGNWVAQQGYYDEQGNWVAQQGYYDEQGNWVAQQGYYDEQGNWVAQQGYYDEQGNWVPQQGYYDEQGNWVPQQGYYDEQGNWVAQQGYYDEQGNRVPQQGYYDEQGNWVAQQDNLVSQEGLYTQEGSWTDQQGYYDEQGGWTPQEGLYSQQESWSSAENAPSVQYQEPAVSGQPQTAPLQEIFESAEEEEAFEPKTELERLIHKLREKGRQGLNAPAVNTAVLDYVKKLEEATTISNDSFGFQSNTGEEMEKLALLDPVTEVTNAKTFHKEFRDEVRRSRRYQQEVSLIIISIDNIAEIKKRYGSLTTDAILKIVSGVVRSMIRDEDLPARYTEEDIAVILPETSGPDAILLAEKIRQRLGIQSITHNWHNIRISASIGVASFPEHARKYDELLAVALGARAIAGQRGGDRVCAP